jgi:cobalt/nickel transport system permease protein
MPDWLLKKDNYIPQNERDAFINKSILSILSILTKFRMQTEHKSNKFGINAAFKVLSALIVIVFVSLSKNSSFIIMIDVFLLLVVSLLNADEILHIIKIGTVASVFTFIILIPSILMGNINNSFLIVLKVLATVTIINITSCTTRWNDIIAALKMLFIPDIFIFVLDTAMKYIFILGEFSLNMLYSLKLRSVGSSRDKTASLSGIIGTLFMKSKEMSEDMYSAMECRGFTGEYKVYRKPKIRINDIICTVICVMLIFLYYYLNRL